MGDDESADGKSPDEHQATASDDAGGYGRPPKSGQFKRGDNRPRPGRPPGARSFKTEARAMLAMPVPVSDGQRTRKVSTRAAAFLKLREKALRGDARALERILDLAREHDLDDSNATTGGLQKEDAEIRDRAVQRRLEELQRSLPQLTPGADSKEEEN